MSDIINILINKVNAINDYIDKTSKVCHVIDDEGIEHIIPMYPSNILMKLSAPTLSVA